jgi:hypothetical protein
MKNYLADGAVIVLSLLLVYWWVDKPQLNLERKPVAPAQPVVPEKQVQGHPSAKAHLEIPEKTARDYQKLEVRNIFSPDGVYAQLPQQKPMPEVAYTLLGVIVAKPKRAVFRDYLGAIVAVGEGEALADGFVIGRIESLSVMVKRGEEEREYKIFPQKKS